MKGSDVSMKNFTRNDSLFSLCGLNCDLCTMKMDGYCPSCGGGAGNQSCAIARCSLEHGAYNYCFECSEFPCNKYNGITEFDSFITHRNQLTDMEKAKNIGISDYHAELEEKATILRYLLSHYNDGRRKTFFSLAVNLLELSDIKAILQKIDSGISSEISQKEKAKIAVKYFEDVAKCNKISLKLNKKPSS